MEKMNPEVRYAFISSVLTAQGPLRAGELQLTREFLDSFIRIVLEAKDFEVTAKEIAEWLHMKNYRSVTDKLQKHYIKDEDYKIETLQTGAPGQPPQEYRLSQNCCKHISMSMDIPRSVLCRKYFVQVEQMYRAFMEDKIGWRMRTDSPQEWSERREINERIRDIPEEPGTYDVNFCLHDEAGVLKKVKKLGSTSGLRSRMSTLPLEYNGTQEIVHLTSNPESARFLEECLHVEAKERRVRGELYDMTDEESARIMNKCHEVDAYRRSLDSEYPSLGPKERSPLSPTAREFFRLKRHQTGLPRRTAGSRPIPSNVPSFVSD